MTNDFKNESKPNKYSLKESTDYPKSYYSFVDKIEILRDDTLEIHLDSVRTEVFDNSPENDNFLLESALYNIILNINETHALRLFGSIESIECSWFKIELTDLETETLAFLFQDNTNLAIGDELYQTFIKSVTLFINDDNKLVQLKSVFSMDKLPDASDIQIKEALDFPFGDTQTINVYNVGQGNLTAICHNNIPSVYIDVGGGSYWNAHTYRSVLDLCYSAYRTVILTHWDADHIWTAHKQIDNFRDRTWIVPRQPLNTLQKTLLKKLQQNGNRILVYPVSNNRIDTTICSLVKCDGPKNNKNEFGIVVYAKSFDHLGAEVKVLLAGDVSYKYITRLSDTDLLIGGLLATHHGAEFKDNNNPIPNSQAPNWIIYSFGLGNSYGHARGKSVKAHYAKGWTNELTTLNGHVSFTSGLKNHNMPCRGKNCSMDFDRGFEIWQ